MIYRRLEFKWGLQESKYIYTNFGAKGLNMIKKICQKCSSRGLGFFCIGILRNHRLIPTTLVSEKTTATLATTM
jgi:hypothetical protein